MMSGDHPSKTAATIWQGQPTETLRISPKELAMRLRADLQARHRWFGAIYVIVGIQIAAMLAVLVAFADPIDRIGAALIVGAMLYLTFQMRLHSIHLRAARADIDRTTTASAEFAMGYLRTRREFHSGIWFWSRLLVMLPGLPVLVYGLARGDLGFVPLSILGAFAAMIAISVAVQRRIARGYQLQIDELRRLQGL